jgi:hypothetical protein
MVSNLHQNWPLLMCCSIILHHLEQSLQAYYQVLLLINTNRGVLARKEVVYDAYLIELLEYAIQKAGVHYIREAT